MQWILALPAQKEGSSINVQKPKQKTEETTNNRKSSIEHDLQRSGNEIGTGNTKTSNGMQTSTEIEKIPEFSPYFLSEYGMKGDNGKGIGDEIALPVSSPKEVSPIKIVKPKLKNQGIDTNRKSSVELDLPGSENEFGTGNSRTSNGKSTPEKQEKVPMFFPHFQNDYGKEGGNGEGILALPAPEEGSAVDVRKPRRKRLIERNLKRSDNEIRTANTTTNNEKRTTKKHEKVPMVSLHFRNDCGKKGDKLEENGDEIAIRKINSQTKIRLEKHEPEGHNKKDVDAELCGYEKIKSKRRRKSKKHEPQGDNDEKIDRESGCYGFGVGFGEEKMLTDGEVKSKEKKKKMVHDKMLENDDDADAEASKFELKMREPQGDNGKKIDPAQGNNGEKIYPKLCGYGSAEMGGQTAIEKFKSKSKRRSKKCKAQVENKEKIDPKPCDGHEIGFLEEKQPTDGNIKSMEKKKAVEDELQETGDGTTTSKFKPKKTGPEFQKDTVHVGGRYVSPSFHNDSAKKVHAKPLDKGSNPEPLVFPTSKDLMGDKVEEDGTRVHINQQGQEKCLFSVVLTSAGNGNGFESISIKLKKKTVESAMIRKACHCSQIDNVEKCVEVEALEHGQGLKGNGNEIETIKVKFKNRKSNDKKTAEEHE